MQNDFVPSFNSNEINLWLSFTKTEYYSNQQIYWLKRGLVLKLRCIPVRTGRITNETLIFVLTYRCILVGRAQSAEQRDVDRH